VLGKSFEININRFNWVKYAPVGKKKAPGITRG
jgi:hypothetical protein